MPKPGSNRIRFEMEVAQILQHGTLEDIEGLAKRWPKDARSAAPALLSVMVYVESQPLPFPPEVGRRYDVKSSNALRIQACLNVVLKACTQIKDVSWSALYNDTLIAIQPYISPLLGWLTFYARESSDGKQIALAGLSLEVLLELKLAYPKMDMPCERVVDLAFDLWVAMPTRFKSLPSLPEAYSSWILPTANPFLTVVGREETSHIIIAKIQQLLTKSANKRLANAFIWHCQQWIELPFEEYKAQRAREPVLSRLLSIVKPAFVIARKAPPFYQALIECQFGPTVLDMGRALSASYSGTKGIPIAVSVGAQLSPRGNDLLAFEVVHVIPEMVTRGYLEVLALDISETPRPSAHPLGGTLQFVRELFASCWHPRLCKAVKAAKPSIPAAILRKLASHPDSLTRNTWAEFVEVIGMYSKLHNMHPSSGRIPICDNLEHQRRNVPVEDVEGRQCHSCRTTVYCSVLCQREDWDALHKEECAKKRQYRIELELLSGWIFHSMRLQFMHLSGMLLEEAISETPSFLESTENHIYLDTLDCPPSWKAVPYAELASLCFEEGRPTWEEDRAQRLVANSRSDSTIKLVACHSLFGQFRVYSLVSFRVQIMRNMSWTPSAVGGTRISCAPLNIYVNVVEKLRRVKSSAQ